MSEENKKHAGGRPTDYLGEETIKLVREYIDSCKDEIVPRLKQENGEKGYVMYENRLRVKLPSIEGLAVYLKVARSTIYEWEKTYSEFSDILDELKARQAEVLLNNGLSGDYNSTITKVILTKHGYVEKNAVEHSGEIKNGLSQEQEAKLNKLLLNKKTTMVDEVIPTPPAEDVEKIGNEAEEAPTVTTTPTVATESTPVVGEPEGVCTDCEPPVAE